MLKTYALHQSVRNIKSACHLSVPQLIPAIAVTPIQTQQGKLESRVVTSVDPHARCRLQLRDSDQQRLVSLHKNFSRTRPISIYRPTLVHCTVYIKSHPGFRSDAFRCLLTPPSESPVCHFFVTYGMISNY